MKIPAIVILVILSLFTSAAASEKQPAPLHSDTEKKDQYEKNMEERFRRLGKSLDELEARAAAMAEQARRDAERSLGDAEKKRKEAGRKLEEMRTEGRKRWARFTEELNAAMDEFEKAYERARSHFKE
jgi:septal ring factor EnvC (AmiA/AmiB activator)